MKVSMMIVSFVVVLFQASFARAQAGFQRGHQDLYDLSTSGSRNYSGRAIACARDVIIAEMEHRLIGSGYTWVKFHVNQGLFQSDATLLRPNKGDNDFGFKFTAILKRVNDPQDKADHPITGSVTVYYINKIDSKYRSSECQIIDEGMFQSEMTATFDETSAIAF